MNISTFRLKYTIALVLITAVVVIFYAITFFLIEDHSKYAKSINLSGKERMLVVKVINNIHSLYHSDSTIHQSLLEESISEFERIDLTLKTSGHLFEEEKKESFLSEAKYILNNSKSIKEFINSEKYESSINYLDEQSEQLIKNIDTFVLELQNESDESVKYIQYIVTIILIIFLLIIIFVALFLFLPAEGEIKEKTSKLTNINKELGNRIRSELEKNNTQTAHMIQQSRFAQMGEMISMIAHQWRQPLASISAVASTLTIDIMMDNYNKKFFKERLESISGLSQHLSSTIDDFRNFFKNDKIKEEMSIRDIIDNTMRIIKETLKSKNIDVIIDVQDDIIIKCYVNEIMQVILNLLKNSEDALIDKKVPDAKIWVKGFLEQSNVCITVEDNAGGIDEDIGKNIFDPYFSTKSNKDGTGLGLYMSKTIINEHCHGELTFKNTQNGACFTIKLPMQHIKATL